MKRCPECYEVHDDGDKFCEADGSELLVDPTFAPPSVPEPAAPPSKASWWPAAALGVLVGVIFGAGAFAVAMLVSTRELSEHPAASQASAVEEKTLPKRSVARSEPAPTAEPEASTSPESEEKAQAEPSPATNTENKTVSVQLNQGPISTGQKTRPGEGDGAVRTVIEMNDGSTLDVDAAWEDKQGIWYRRSGLVSFVDSSRVKAITARKETKVAEAPQR